MLTRDEIKRLPLRKLDALVAERVDGLSVVWAPDPYRVPDRRLTDHHPWLKQDLDRQPPSWTPVLRYSTDWNTVPAVILSMEKLDMWCQLRAGQSSEQIADDENRYQAFFMPHCLDGNQHGFRFTMSGSDAPLAIARAAILAIELAKTTREWK